MKFDDIYNELIKNKNEVFFKLYADKFGPGVLISIPEDNFDDFYRCALGLRLTLSKVRYRKFVNLYVQKVDGDFAILKKLQTAFNFEIYENFKKDRLDFSESDMICDNIFKHNPVSLFGMGCMHVYHRYFRSED